MINVQQYIPEPGSTWIKDYYDKMGDDLTEYYNKVFLHLYKMKPGDQFDIEKKVDPQNYDLFIKCLILVYQQLHSCGMTDFFLEGSMILRR